jgi:cation-transporting P-type ATPase I
VSVLCFDKTGTLTEGRIRLRWVSDLAAVEEVRRLSGGRRAVLAAALRACPRRRGDEPILHMTDAAVVDGAEAAGVRPDEGLGGWEVVAELPFEPARGFHAVLGRHGADHWLSVKGAPEVVLPRCRSWRHGGSATVLDEPARASVEAAVDRLARAGWRVLAVAERPTSARAGLTEARVDGLEFRGLLALADRARPTAAQAVRSLRAAGVELVMVTGDHPSTAEAIAAELGILNGRRVMTGTDLEAVTEAELDAVVGQVSVFARMSPAHKVAVVRALHRTGHVVAVTGDGANDAPAIRAADVGVALGPLSTNAARGAADVVVTDDRIETLTDAIVEGRAMWSSVRDAVAVLLGGNLGEAAFTLAGSLFDGASPLNARQLLLVNLLTDLLPSTALAVRPPGATSPERLLQEGPDQSLGTTLTTDIVDRGLRTAGSAAGAWLVGRTTGSRNRASTIALVTLVGVQLGQTLAVAHRDPVVLAAVLGSAGVTAAIVQTPGVSHFFGCRPLGPVGWATAISAAGIGTVAPRRS